MSPFASPVLLALLNAWAVAILAASSTPAAFSTFRSLTVTPVVEKR